MIDNDGQYASTSPELVFCTFASRPHKMDGIIMFNGLVMIQKKRNAHGKAICQFKISKK